MEKPSTKRTIRDSSLHQSREECSHHHGRTGQKYCSLSQEYSEGNHDGYSRIEYISRGQSFKSCYYQGSPAASASLDGEDIMNDSEARQLIISPVITEKGTVLQEANNQYLFRVDVRANKIRIAAAIAKIFKVEVTGVRTLTVHGKIRESAGPEGRSRAGRRQS